MSEAKSNLFYDQKNGWDIIGDDEKSAVNAYSEEYKQFLQKARTERLAVKEGIRLAEAAGFVEYERGMALTPGLKVYKSVRGKALLLAVIGKKPLSEGVNIAAAHVDSPRLDLKQNPMYEDEEVAYFKTHYYGGIKKYQWVTIPLEMHGVVALLDGSVVPVTIGEDPADPVLVITDLLPHLAKDQMKKALSEGIAAEALNIVIGSVPDSEEKDAGDRVKLAVLKILNEKYGITEEDFLSAELEVVPSIPVRDAGLDRSLIAGYGHDDRVCAFAELKAIYNIGTPEKTAVCILADKEEIGSEGVSGMQSEAFECFVGDLCRSQGVELRHCFEKSFCISADVTNAFDPVYAEVSDKRNNAKINYGVGLAKFTGARGKSGSNDASAEVVGKLRRIFKDNGVIWQMGELGKVDQGGGGTVAMYMAKRNIDTIDAGVPVLSMHSPYEMVAKLDCYMTYKAVKALYESNK
jgi:aspartyl aminopeptidase